ncbi:DBP2 [Symbiodinium necroappetens]|uniref:DBP2 protein n=1 Tax=Symbiodinium necroappetens TaxID=1628268 RepID=A0A812KVQ9_9DINO|nr:DBP2 [Symbiodinium necroappetens]
MFSATWPEALRPGMIGAVKELAQEHHVRRFALRQMADHPQLGVQVLCVVSGKSIVQRAEIVDDNEAKFTKLKEAAPDQCSSIPSMLLETSEEGSGVMVRYEMAIFQAGSTDKCIIFCRRGCVMAATAQLVWYGVVEMSST